MNSRDLLKFLAPDFDDLPDATLDIALNLASQRVSAKAFGSLYPQAAALMAAHILAKGRGVGTQAGIAGSVTAIKEGDLSISGVALPGIDGSDASLASTPYGAQYMELRDQIPVSPYV